MLLVFFFFYFFIFFGGCVSIYAVLINEYYWIFKKYVNPRVDSGQESGRIRQEAGRIPAGIIGKMKKYFIFLKKYLFKQKCDYNYYC
jgi:hypothetical protein